LSDGFDALLDIDCIGSNFRVRFAYASSSGDRQRVAHGPPDQINCGLGEST
jgi:hypothetical protein